MVPAMLTPIVGGLGAWWMTAGETWLKFIGFVLISWACVLLYAAFKNCNEYFAEGNIQRFERKQHALAITPVTLMAQALPGLHPDAVKVLNKFGVRTVYQVKVDMKKGDRDWILLGTNVHFGFIQYVLDHSNPRSLMPKRMLSDGSRRFDADGLVTDYEQYDELQQWLIARMIITRPFGDNSPSMFLPPWNPDLVKEKMGFSGPVDLEDAEQEPIAETQAVKAQQLIQSKPAQAKQDMQPLNDEERSRIETENQRYKALFRSN